MVGTELENILRHLVLTLIHSSTTRNPSLLTATITAAASMVRLHGNKICFIFIIKKEASKFRVIFLVQGNLGAANQKLLPWSLPLFSPFITPTQVRCCYYKPFKITVSNCHFFSVFLHSTSRFPFLK